MAKTITIKTDKVQGKLYVEPTCWNTKDGVLRLYTDSEVAGRETIKVNRHDLECHMFIQRKKETRVYSIAKQRHIDIPVEKQKFTYEIYRWSLLSPASFRPTYAHSKMVLESVLPLIEPLFDDPKLHLDSRLKLLKSVIETSERRKKEAETELQKYTEKLNSAKILLKLRDSDKIAKFLEKH